MNEVHKSEFMRNELIIIIMINDKYKEIYVFYIQILNILSPTVPQRVYFFF